MKTEKGETGKVSMRKLNLKKKHEKGISDSSGRFYGSKNDQKATEKLTAVATLSGDEKIYILTH